MYLPSLEATGSETGHKLKQDQHKRQNLANSGETTNAPASIPGERPGIIETDVCLVTVTAVKWFLGKRIMVNALKVVLFGVPTRPTIVPKKLPLASVPVCLIVAFPVNFPPPSCPAKSELGSNG
jgi:hypothetical protein